MEQVIGGGRRAWARWEGDACDGDHVYGQGRVNRGHHDVSEAERGIHHHAAEEVNAQGEVGHTLTGVKVDGPKGQ